MTRTQCYLSTVTDRHDCRNVPQCRSRVQRYLIVNLARERIATSAGTYRDALRIANELERDTGQLHGIERG